MADATGKGRKSCKNVDILERNEDELDGCGGSGGLGSSGGLGKTGNVSVLGTAGKGKARGKTQETRKSENRNSNQRPVSCIARDSKDTACWSCSSPNARWICSCHGCEIRFCCCCNRCPCTMPSNPEFGSIGTVTTVTCNGGGACAEINPEFDSTQFHCPLCRAKGGCPPVTQFGQRDVCFTCLSQCEKTVHCQTCKNLFCLECARAVSAFMTKFTCLICLCADKGMLLGRKEYMKSLKGLLDRTFRQITGSDLKSINQRTAKMTRAAMLAHYDTAINLSHVMTLMCQAGFDEVVESSALKGLAHINDSYTLGLNSSPCAVLDLVYLLDDHNIQWKSVELAARAHGRAELAKVRGFDMHSPTRQVAQRIDDTSRGSEKAFRVGFYSHDLAIGSATNDLVHQVLISLDGWKGMFEVFIYSNKCTKKGKGLSNHGYDKLCWRSKALVEHYLLKNRCRLFSKKTQPIDKAKKIIRDRLDLFVHIPGFNYGGLYQVLYLVRIHSPNTCVVQWLGCAGMLHSPEAVHFTISSKSVLDRKLLSTAHKDCEAAVLFDNAYPLPEIPEHLLVTDATVNGSKFFNLPENRRRLCFAGTSTRIRRERLILALRILVACGHGPTSPVLFIMLYGGDFNGGVAMFISVLCWAEEWRKENCPAFDIFDRIRPYRFCANQQEWYIFILQMHVCLDCHPCGFHTSALEVLALCKCFVALRGYLASWPSLVAAAKLEQGGYGKALVADCDDEYIVLVVRLLQNKEFTDALEQKMRLDKAAAIGMYDTIGSLENWELAVPLMISKVRAGGVLEDIDIASKLSARPPGGISSPDICMFDSPKAQREAILQAMATTGRGFAGYWEGARRVLEKAQEDGLDLLGLAGTGAFNFAIRAVYNGLENKHVFKGQRVILKVRHAGRMNDPAHLCQVGQEQMDSNLRSAYFMESVHRSLEGAEQEHFVVKGVPIFKKSSGQSCVSGYLVVGSRGTLNACAISFHCCEDMGSDLEQSGMLDTWAESFRQSGLISEDLRRFYESLCSGLEVLHRRGLYVIAW